MSARVMKHTMVVRNPDTMEATALLAGEKVPDWVTDELVHPDNFGTPEKSDDSGSSDDATDYASKTPEELQALADERELTVEGTGKNGNVLKGDLVAALEADDSKS